MLNYSSEKKNLKKKQFHSNYDKCLFVMIKFFDKSGVVYVRIELGAFFGAFEQKGEKSWADQWELAKFGG